MDKKQIRLDPDERIARSLWHRLMADEGLLTKGEKRALTVTEAVDLFLESRSLRRKLTVSNYEKFLVPFAKTFGSARLAELRPTDVIVYCHAKESWRAGTSRNLFAQVATLMRWARDTGYIDLNPMAGVQNPWPPPQNRRPMSAAEYQAIIGGVNDPELRLLVRVLWSTGCRPSEAYNLRARHLHPLQPIATLQPAEHKTGGRTGKCRYIIFPRRLMDELRQMASVYVSGPILRNTLGRPWTLYSVCKRFADCRRKFGLADGVVPYSTRHAFATDLATTKPNESPLLLAKIIGHSNAETFQSVYYHPDMIKMIDIVDSEDGHGRPIESPDTGPSDVA